MLILKQIMYNHSESEYLFFVVEMASLKKEVISEIQMFIATVNKYFSNWLIYLWRGRRLYIIFHIYCFKIKNTIKTRTQLF